MRLFIAEDLINILECGNFTLFSKSDLQDIIDAVKCEAEQNIIFPAIPGGYIDADNFIGRILNGEYIFLQHIKYELAGSIDMFYNVFGLEDDN